IDLERRRDFSEHDRERQEKERRDETDYAETADRAKHRGRAFHEDTVKRPAKTRDERDGETAQRHRAGLPAFLKTHNADRADESERRAHLKLPLPNDAAFFRKKDQGEERGEDDRGAAKDRVN